MQIISAKYIGSFNKLEQLPANDLKEFAFIGRSNVGKSSLINMLLNRKDLARVSKQPGKTQSLNYYLINDRWHLVDCPGYGFAKKSQQLKKDWSILIKIFLAERKQLWNVFVLIDCNIPPQKNDLEFANWLGENQIPFSLIFTKADRQSKLKTEKSVQAFEKELLKSWQFLPQTFITSAEKVTGKDEVMDHINNQVKG